MKRMLHRSQWTTPFHRGFQREQCFVLRCAKRGFKASACGPVRRVMIVRGRGTSASGVVFLGVGGSPRGFCFGRDGELGDGVDRVLEAECQSTPRGA